MYFGLLNVFMNYNNVQSAKNCFVRARTRARANIPVHLLLYEVYFISINYDNVQLYPQYAICNNIFLVNWLYRKGSLCFFLSIMIIYKLSKEYDA